MPYFSQKILYMQSIGYYQEVISNYFATTSIVKEPANLYEPISYILSLGGKRIRPVLTLMTAEIFDADCREAFIDGSDDTASAFVARRLVETGVDDEGAFGGVGDDVEESSADDPERNRPQCDVQNDPGLGTALGETVRGDPDRRDDSDEDTNRVRVDLEVEGDVPAKGVVQHLGHVERELVRCRAGNAEGGEQ